jgi:hypothetical protein
VAGGWQRVPAWLAVVLLVSPLRAEPAAEQPPIEVVVQGERPPRDGSELGARETRQLPGAFGDPFRAVEAIPGVSPVVSGLPYFFVRGAPPGNVGYFLDGIRVPLLYHAFAGPSVVHPSFIDHVELYRGGYPARYGRFAGGIVEAESAKLRRDWHGEASVRLIDAGAMAEAPLPGGHGGLLLGGRYSYTAAILSQLSSTLPGLGSASTKLEYWDYQLLSSYELGPHDTVGVLALGALDYAASQGVTFAGVEFHRVDLRYEHELDPRTRLRAAVTLGVDRTRTETGVTLNVGGGTQRSQPASLWDVPIMTRLELTHAPSRRVEVRAGTDLTVDQFGVRLNPLLPAAKIEKFFATRDDVALGGFAELMLQPDPGVTVIPGLRADAYQSRDVTRVAIEPRLSAAFDVSRQVRMLHAVGLAHQPPAVAPPGIPAAQQIAGLPGGLQTSLQASSGVEVSLPADFVATATVFDNVFWNLWDPLGITGEIDFDTADTRSMGSAVGLELALRRPLTRRLGGFLNYTLSRSTRSRDHLHCLSAFDRTHVANLVLAYDLGQRWRVGGRLYYFSGVPVRVPTTDGPRFVDSRRAPDFWRLDLRVEKRWRVGKAGWVAAVAEVLNTTAGREVVQRSCNASGCRDAVFGPLILPSLGVEGGF